MKEVKEEIAANKLERKLMANLTPCYKCGGTKPRTERDVGQRSPLENDCD